MPKIQVLDKHTAELIAAGEVVERPSSVVKELMENSIDAGATSLSVEIQNGGVTSIRITDNGCGITREDVPVAFLRHATSKVRTKDDLDAIGTLGFRGEALASVCAVAKVELTTRTAEEMAGTRYLIEGGDEILTEDIGCPQGTTITVRDLFYNVPARMKFLKKDVSEANSVAGVVDRVALSHPEVSVRFSRDGKEELMTPGDGKLLSCIYAVFGREFAAGLLPIEYTLGGIQLHGYISKTSSPRANRTMQHFFINGRYVKTRTAMAALEEAYKGSIMVGKFPSCVMHIDMPLEAVDVNVHPAKIEVRFINERPIFDCVYHGVKSALQAGDGHAAMSLPKRAAQAGSIQTDPALPKMPAFQKASADPVPPPEQTKLSAAGTGRGAAGMGKPSVSGVPEEPVPSEQTLVFRPPVTPDHSSVFGGVIADSSLFSGFGTLHDGGGLPYNRPIYVPDIVCDDEPTTKMSPAATSSERIHNEVQNTQTLKSANVETIPQAGKAEVEPDAQNGGAEEIPPVRFLGEAFGTYILAQQGSSLFIIDKHAAHERILYNQFKSSDHTDAQLLLSPVSVQLSREEYAALLPELETMKKAGFEVEDFGGHCVLVRALPMMLSGGDAAGIIQEIAGGLAAGKHEITTDKLDWIYHSSACRAAIKAGDISKPEELQTIAERVLLDNDIRTCPHGRPVCYELTRHELEKQFGRTK